MIREQLEIQIGITEFRQKIAGVSEEEIRKSWEPGLATTRKCGKNI